MLKNIFAKTLYERRWGLLWWTLAMLLMTLFVMLIFPTFKDTFGQQLNNVPDSLKSVFGEAADYQRIEGFIELQVFLQMIFLTIIYGAILFSGLLAGDEGDGTLQTLLSQPVKRQQVYFQKLLAGGLLLAVVCLGMFAGIALGALAIGESVNLWRVLQGTFNVWLITAVFSLMAYSLGAITGRRGLSGGLAGVYAFMSYLVTSLVATVSFLKVVNYLSPIKYLSSPRVMDHGLSLSNVAILAAAGAGLIALGWITFKKRDVYQR